MAAGRRHLGRPRLAIDRIAGLALESGSYPAVAWPWSAAGGCGGLAARSGALWSAVGGGGPVPVCAGRQRDLDLQSAVWPGVGLGVAAVRFGHRCDDGQAEPGAWPGAGAAGEAAERLEQPG